MGTAVDRLFHSNIHLEGRCKDFLRLAFLAAQATDRTARRAEHNDTIQDIRLQRQAGSLAFRILSLAYDHNDHDYTTHPKTSY